MLSEHIIIDYSLSHDIFNIGPGTIRIHY